MSEHMKRRSGKVDIQEAREMLKAAAATQPEDFCYNPRDLGRLSSCFNVPQDLGPYDPRSITGCLIGTAMTLWGFRVHKQRKHVESNVACFTNQFTSRAIEYLFQAQSHQDSGSTWGEAVRKAEALYEALYAHTTSTDGER